MTVNKPLRISDDLAKRIEEEAERTGKSQNDVMNDWLEEGAKKTRAQYKGFVQRIMTFDYTCFKCDEKKEKGTVAMYDSETGACMCIECAITNKVTSPARVKLLVQKLEMKEDVRALKEEMKRLSEEYVQKELELINDLDKTEFASRLPELQQIINKLRQSFDNIKTKGIDPNDWEDFMRTVRQAQQVVIDHQIH